MVLRFPMVRTTDQSTQSYSINLVEDLTRFCTLRRTYHRIRFSLHAVWFHCCFRHLKLSTILKSDFSGISGQKVHYREARQHSKVLDAKHNHATSETLAAGFFRCMCHFRKL